MTISFVCPNCHQTLNVADQWAGRKGRCPKCQGEILVPTGQQPSTPANWADGNETQQPASHYQQTPSHYGQASGAESNPYASANPYSAPMDNPYAAPSYGGGSPQSGGMGEFTYAGFGPRAAAFIIDNIIVGALSIGLMFALLFVAVGAGINEDDDGFGILIMLVLYGSLYIGGWLYEAVLTASSWQGTLGKKALSIKVVNEQGERVTFNQSLGRTLIKGLCACFSSWLVYIVVAVADKNQGVHDMVAKTYVIYDR